MPQQIISTLFGLYTKNEKVDRFDIYERGTNYNEVSRIATVTDDIGVMQDISRDAVCIFPVSAMTTTSMNAAAVVKPPLLERI